MDDIGMQISNFGYFCCQNQEEKKPPKNLINSLDRQKERKKERKKEREREDRDKQRDVAGQSIDDIDMQMRRYANIESKLK